MTEIAYMIREDWGQHGTAMVPNSVKIRDWLGAPPYEFAVASDRQGRAKPSEADEEMMRYLAPAPGEAGLTTFSALNRLQREGRQADRSVILLHPYKEHECDLLREIAASGAFQRIFVQIWAPSDQVRLVLDSLGAVNLHTGEPASPLDPVLVEAARMIESVAYNGLGSGRGKETAIQLLRALRDAGYPLEKETWLQAYFSVGGEARHAETLAKYITEMKQGVQHRVKQQSGSHLLELLRERATRSRS